MAARAHTQDAAGRGGVCVCEGRRVLVFEGGGERGGAPLLLSLSFARSLVAAPPPLNHDRAAGVDQHSRCGVGVGLAAAGGEREREAKAQEEGDSSGLSSLSLALSLFVRGGFEWAWGDVRESRGDVGSERRSALVWFVVCERRPVRARARTFSASAASAAAPSAKVGSRRLPAVAPPSPSNQTTKTARTHARTTPKPKLRTRTHSYYST
jgi:hypothetical protein